MFIICIHVCTVPYSELQSLFEPYFWTCLQKGQYPLEREEITFDHNKQNSNYYVTTGITFEPPCQHPYSLHSAPYIFMVLEDGRICLNIKKFCCWWSFLYSQVKNQWHSKEELDAGRYQGFKPCNNTTTCRSKLFPWQIPKTLSSVISMTVVTIEDN